MADKNKFDVVVIGAGPAGYVSAIRCAQLGLDTALVDNWKNLDGAHAFGGTCLNAGCIPSKALLESSEVFHRTTHEFEAHGIKIGGKVAMDVAAMQARKQKIVSGLTGGIGQLLKGNKITTFKGTGVFTGKGRVEVTDLEDGKKKRTLEGTHVVLAGGSVPVELKSAPFDGTRIVDSWGALEFDAVPKRLGVIGAGVIGLELGSVWKRLGSEVTLLEAQDDFLFMVDRQIAKESQRHFKKAGLDIKLGAKVTGAKAGKSSVKVSFEDKDGKHELTFDKLIVAVGRRPNSGPLLGENCGVKADQRGFVEVDEHCRTKVDNVWAIGDLVRGPMLAHKGSEEGVLVAELIAGHHAEVNYDAIPSIMYTAPELAWVGKTEEEVKKSGRPYKTGSFSFAPNGRAKAMEAAAGTVKIIADKEHDTILGVHMVGPMVSELIMEAVVAMEFSASAEDLQRICHGHPTLAEVVHEAALAVDGRALHSINK